MRLLIACGLVSPSEISAQVLADEKAMGILYDLTSQLIKSGWRPTLAEMESLTICERAALLRARVAYDSECAVQSSLAHQGLPGLALAAEGSDGGEMRRDLAISTGLAGAVQRARGMGPEKTS